MSAQNYPNSNSGIPQIPGGTGPAESGPSPEELKKQRQVTAGAVIGGIVLLAIVVGFFWIVGSDPGRASLVRDLFIIAMALMSLFIGLTLVILIVQLARLINLLQNEIKPILDSTNETVSTMRGTVEFLGDNLTEPVMKLNEYLAALTQVRQFFKTIRKN